MGVEKVELLAGKVWGRNIELLTTGFWVRGDDPRLIHS